MSTGADDAGPPPIALGGADPAPPHPEGIRGGVIVVVAVATSVVVACGVWVAWTIAGSMGDREPAARWGAPSDDIQAIEMSLLPRIDAEREQGAAPKDASSEPRRFDREARARLGSYGYSDRRRGTVHIPLARAKQLYLERERARAGAAEVPQPPRRVP
jgi:hypothetical protein